MPTTGDTHLQLASASLRQLLEDARIPDTIRSTLSEDYAQVRAMLDKLEHVKASIRAKVEHPFRVIKRQFGHAKVRYRGLAKNTAQLHTLFALSNLWMVRRTLLQGARG